MNIFPLFRLQDYRQTKKKSKKSLRILEMPWNTEFKKVTDRVQKGYFIVYKKVS